MHKGIEGTLQREKGTVAVFVAVSLLMLMGMAALALDGGMSYNERRASQNTADNAALAGAWDLCNGGTPSTALDAATASADSNGFSDGVNVAIDGMEVSVAISSGVETTFGATQGADEVRVASEATALCESGSGAGAAAMFAKGPGCKLEKGGTADVTGDVYSAGNMTWNGGGSQTIDGSIHSDSNLTLNGGPPAITGTITATGTGNPSTEIGHAPAKNLPYPVTYQISDFAPGSPIASAANAVGRYHQHAAGNVRADDIDVPGIHYITGNVTQQGGLDANHITIIATGSVRLNNANITPYHEGLAIMAGATSPPSCNTAIDIGGSGIITNGILFAPNGQIEVHGGNVNGGLIGWSIDTGGNLNVSVDASLFPGNSPEVLLVK